MNAHLIKSAEVDSELFTEIVNLLQAVPGPIQFSYNADAVIDFDRDELFDNVIPDLKKFEQKEQRLYSSALMSEQDFPLERQTASWKTLFNKCSRYRQKMGIAENEFVLLLTDIPNEANWFASLDEQMPYNGFIHTADWAHYIDCSPAFPIAYEVLALMIQKHIFSGIEDLRRSVHARPIGCISDFCMEKREVILKLRTADICHNCMDTIKKKLSVPVIHQTLKLLEFFRIQMLYSQNFKQAWPLSPLVIDAQKRFYLPDFDSIEIKLRPLEKALYLLFLAHPEGIFLSALSDHRQELYDIYEGLSSMGMRLELQGRIDDMVNVLNNSANEKMSRIKRVFEESIGSHLAKNYYIRGAVGETKSITLDRSLVEFR